MWFIALNAAAANARAEVNTRCTQDLRAKLSSFLAGGEPANDNPLFSQLRACGDREALNALLEALTRRVPGHDPAEVSSAIEAVLASPELANNAAATEMVTERFGAVSDPEARVSLAYLLGWRGAAPALNGILRNDPVAAVRAAAAVALRNCKSVSDFSPLWQAAKSDPDRSTRAQAYQTLDRFGQVRGPNDFLAASRNQTDAASAGRYLGRWLAGAPAEATAEKLTRLAEHVGSDEASGALAEILVALETRQQSLFATATAPNAPPMPPGASKSLPSAPLRSLPMPSSKPAESELQRALLSRSDRITRAALAQFAASKAMQEDAARGAIDCALAINRCNPGGCERLDELLRTTDRMEPPLALEASQDISAKLGTLYFARRHRQYALLFSLAFLAALAWSILGIVRGGQRLLAIGSGWLILLIVAAVLQFTGGADSGVRVWPPPLLWPATALGSVVVTLMVAVAATLARGRKGLVPAALIFGEISWWVLPMLFAAAGITLKMQHYSQDEDWLPFMLAVLMMVGAPLLTLAVSGIAWRIQRLLLAANER